MLAHLSPAANLDEYSLVTIEIPRDIEIEQLYLKDLPNNWQDAFNQQFTQSAGDRWRQESTTAVFRVPSAIINDEFSYLLNPGHPDFSRIQIISIDRYNFDSGLFSGEYSENREADYEDDDPEFPADEQTLEDEDQNRENEDDQKAELQDALISEGIDLSLDKMQFRSHTATAGPPPTGTYNSNIFLSYEADDITIALSIKERLEYYGFKVWMDYENILLGNNIIERINFGIRKSKFMLALISRKYSKKPFTKFELSIGVYIQVLRKKKYLLPILLGTPADHKKIKLENPVILPFAHQPWRNDPEAIAQSIIFTMAGK